MTQQTGITVIQETMDRIKNYDCKPAVFRVWVQAASFLDGYEAVVEFRTGSVSMITAKGSTPEEALTNIYTTLEDYYGKCIFCGEYPTHAE